MAIMFSWTKMQKFQQQITIENVFDFETGEY